MRAVQRERELIAEELERRRRKFWARMEELRGRIHALEQATRNAHNRYIAGPQTPTLREEMCRAMDVAEAHRRRLARIEAYCRGEIETEPSGGPL